jgi:hypothetical protein
MVLNGETLIAELRSPSTAAFTAQSAIRQSTDHAPDSESANEDQPNPGVTVLTVALAAGSQTRVEAEVLFKWMSPLLFSSRPPSFSSLFLDVCDRVLLDLSCCNSPQWSEYDSNSYATRPLTLLSTAGHSPHTSRSTSPLIELL